MASLIADRAGITQGIRFDPDPWGGLAERRQSGESFQEASRNQLFNRPPSV
jgi:hypothetical protein